MAGFWKSVFEIKPEPVGIRRPLRLVASIAVSAVVTSLIFGPAYASLGFLFMMIAKAGVGRPLWSRIKINIILFLVGLIITSIIVPLHSHYHYDVLVGVVACTFLLWSWYIFNIPQAFRIPFVFMPLAILFAAGHGTPLHRMLLINTVAWLVSFIVDIILAYPGRFNPERTAMAAARRSVEKYLSSSGDREQERRQVYIDLGTANDILHSSHNRETKALQQELDSLYGQMVGDFRKNHYPAVPTADYAFSTLTELQPPRLRTRIRRGLTPGTIPFNIGLATLITLLIVEAIGVVLPSTHVHWAVSAALIALHMGFSRVDTLVHITRRVLGTIIGVLCYVGIEQFITSPWERIIILIIGCFFMFFFSPRNYGICVIFITIFTLSITTTSASITWMVLARDRVIETFIGLIVGFFVLYLLSPPARIMDTYFRMHLNAIYALLRLIARGEFNDAQAMRARRAVLFSVGETARLAQRTQKDAPRIMAFWSGVETRLISLSALLLAAAWHLRSSQDQVEIERYQQAAVQAMVSLDQVRGHYWVRANSVEEGPQAAAQLRKIIQAFIAATQ